MLSFPEHWVVTIDSSAVSLTLGKTLINLDFDTVKKGELLLLSHLSMHTIDAFGGFSLPSN